MRAAPLLLLALLVAGCSAPSSQTPGAGLAGIQTIDGERLSYDLRESGTSAVILLHMYGSDRTAWAPYLDALGAGRTVQAIDFRGHGQSTGTPSQAGYVVDTQAAVAFLRERGYADIALVGASVGVNAAVRTAADDPSIRTIVLISPGLEYQGVAIADALPSVAVPILYMVDAQDAPAWEAYQELATTNRNIAPIFITGAGHGTDIFSSTRGADFVTTISEWLEDKL